MEEKIPDIEILGTNFKKMDEKMSFSKEQLSKFEKNEKLNINYKKCHVAISPNGGYVAVCKKRNFEDEDEFSKLHDYVLVMHQDGKTKYYLPIDWNYDTRWLICFDFNEKEQLFGICNDGTIIKFDIINLKSVTKGTIDYFQNDNIEKAKFFQNGFLALTQKGIFYFIKDIKKPELDKVFSMNEILNFSNNIEFLIIPPSNSKSRNIELLITNEKGIGVIHIEYNNKEIIKEENKDTINGVSIMINDKLESKFKEYSTMQPSTYVEEYKTLDGKAIILPDDEKNEKYFNNINKYFTIQGDILDKLNLSLKAFFNNMIAVTESLQNVQKNFEILNLLNTKVLLKENITKLYKEMSRFFNNYKKILIKQSKMVKIHMKDFFKYINLEGKAYKELIERREELKVKYSAEYQRVTTKKEKLYNTLDTNKFELGEDKNREDKNRLLNDKNYSMEHICRNDTSSLIKIYNQLGYANKMNIVELKKLIQEYSSRYVNNVKKFDEEFYPSINDLVTSWSNLETFVMSANLSK